VVRFRTALLVLFFVLAIGALGASSAFAACSGGTQSIFCFSNNTEIHLEGGSGTTGLMLFHASAGGAEVKVDCKDGKGKGTFELLGTTKGEVEFLGCSVISPPNCGINNPVIAKFTSQLSTGTMPATDLITGAGPDEEFTKATITGASCSLANTYSVSGLQTVELPNGETSLAEHEIVAKKSGSKIKLGTETGSFSTTAKVQLTSNALFLIMLGI
jgi:hypothetical protein